MRSNPALPNRRAILAVCVGALSIFGIGGPVAAAPDASRQAELQRLLDHDCGACHGLTRKGGLGSPLRPEALAGQSDEVLESVILDGLSGTAMPAWHGLLSDDDARWLIHRLRSGKP